MRKFVRAMLIWFAVFAIPVQGFASATMLLCGPSHRAVSSASVAMEAGLMAGHPHQAQQQHDALVTTSAAPHCHDEAAAPTHDEGSSLKLFKSKCSACAYCCMAAFMPSRELTVSVTHIPTRPIAYLPISFVGFAPDAFERPPRA
jgi:hypothetical protein